MSLEGLTHDEIVEFLEAQRTVVLGTVRKSGAPVLHALWFTYLDDALYINMQADSFKQRTIEGDNRVCCLVESGEGFFELRGVRVEGRAVQVTDPDEWARVRAAQIAKAERIGDGLAELPDHFTESRQKRLERGERVMYRVPFEKVWSWDFGRNRKDYPGREGKTHD